MKIAVISDIHGNYEALTRVLADIEALKADKVVCLGDCIGYGPEPDAVIGAMQSRQIPTLLGNHELAVRDKAHMNWFNPRAKNSLELTIAMLSPSSLNFIQNLPTSLVMVEGYCVHGFPPDSVQTYLFQTRDLELQATFNTLEQPICFVGHTHDLELIEFDGQRVARQPLFPGGIQLKPDHRYIVNVGSVGQPRDGTNHAKYVLWHRDENRLEVRSVKYDIGSVAKKILAVGLPEENATRLW